MKPRLPILVGDEHDAIPVAGDVVLLDIPGNVCRQGSLLLGREVVPRQSHELGIAIREPVERAAVPRPANRRPPHRVISGLRDYLDLSRGKFDDLDARLGPVGPELDRDDPALVRRPVLGAAGPDGILDPSPCRRVRRAHDIEVAIGAVTCIAREREEVSPGRPEQPRVPPIMIGEGAKSACCPVAQEKLIVLLSRLVSAITSRSREGWGETHETGRPNDVNCCSGWSG